MQAFRLLDGIAFAGDRAAFIGVEMKHVGMLERRRQGVEMIGAAGRASRRRASSRLRLCGRSLKTSAEFVAAESHEKEAADIEDLRLVGFPSIGKCCLREETVGADVVDEPAILSLDVEDQRLAGGGFARSTECCRLDARFRERFPGECAERVLADETRDTRPKRPSWQRSTATLLAQPPVARKHSSVRTSSPAPEGDRPERRRDRRR